LVVSKGSQVIGTPEGSEDGRKQNARARRLSVAILKAKAHKARAGYLNSPSGAGLRTLGAFS
jgi:hypothetical protein